MSELPDQHRSAPENEAEEVTRPSEKRPRKYAPVERVASIGIAEDAEARRDFFSEALREALAPFAGVLERRINPFLAALEAIPDDVERLTHANVSLPMIGPILDQPPVEPASQSDSETERAKYVRYLRPPGALPPGEFENRCTRCGKCVEACPAQAIRMDAYAIMADGLPAIVPATQPCVVCTSLACMPSCPSGALQVVEKLKIRLGTARVDRELCRRESGEDCRLCVEACPIDGSAGREAAIFIHEQTGRIRVRKNVCIGCGMCENRCPTNPTAIVVEPYRTPVDPIVA
jgi:ferredoxin-type protein NapG